MLAGEPLVRIDVTELQAKLVLRQSIDAFVNFHSASTTEAWYVHEITPEIKATQEIQCPSEVTYVQEVYGVVGKNFLWASGFGPEVSSGHTAMFGSFGYMMNDKVSYYLAQREMSYAEKTLSPPPRWVYQEATQRLRIYEGQSKFVVGDKIAYRARISIMDQESYFWAVPWFLKYTSALLREQWANNLLKYSNLQMPGGYTVNASEILSNAKEDISALETSMVEESAIMYPVIAFG
jgi:hypothetical protein